MARKQQDIREINAAMNRFMREPESQQIGSPFRRNVYAQARLKGKSPEEALEIARKPETKQCLKLMFILRLKFLKKKSGKP